MLVSQLRPGTAVYVPAQAAAGAVTVNHLGIISNRRDAQGLPLVVNASKRTGRVEEETWANFTQGHDATVASIEAQYPPLEIVRRARSKIGHRWDLFLANCEHFASWARNGVAESPQLAAAAALVLFVLGAGAVAYAATNSKIEPRRRRR
jgi:hypothetical protein